MSALSPDTRPEAEAVLIRLRREMPPSRKIEMISGLKERYPHDPPELIQRRLADLLLGPDLAAKVYGAIEENNDAR